MAVNLSGEYEQGSKGSRELPKLQRTSQSTDVRRSCAREQLESSCGGNAEEDGDRRRDVAAGDSGVARKQAERRLERDRVVRA